MKKSLADCIAQYIKVLIARTENRQIEIQRAEIAETFSCVPSQVTYVLGTRFREEDGYCTVSRRGGRGYVRITQLKPECGAAVDNEPLLEFLDELKREKLLNQREKEMLKYIVVAAGENLPPEEKIRVDQGIATALRQFLNIKPEL